MPSASALTVLAKSIGEQLDAAERAAAEPGPDGIHDFRVATRRLRAALELWLAVSPNRKLDRGRRSLRTLGRRLGALRETDVNLQELAGLRERDPSAAVGVEFVISGEARRRRSRAKSFAKEMRRTDLGDVSKEIRSEVGAALDAPGDVSPASVARGELDARIPRLRAIFERARLRPTPASLHRLRIELKKFRYSVELCAPAYDGRSVPGLVARLKTLQDALGIVHDAHALHGRIATLRADLRRQGLPALERALLPPMRAIARLSRERAGAALRELEACRREGFLSKFRRALR